VNFASPIHSYSSLEGQWMLICPRDSMPTPVKGTDVDQFPKNIPIMKLIETWQKNVTQGESSLATSTPLEWILENRILCRVCLVTLYFFFDHYDMNSIVVFFLSPGKS
jgi:hypothetical protein